VPGDARSFGKRCYWQTTYELAEPKLLPKGTKLIYNPAYDNSTQNKENPDPSIEVHWGEQTWQEMIYGSVRFRYADEVNESPKWQRNNRAAG